MNDSDRAIINKAIAKSPALKRKLRVHDKYVTIGNEKFEIESRVSVSPDDSNAISDIRKLFVLCEAVGERRFEELEGSPLSFIDANGSTQIKAEDVEYFCLRARAKTTPKLTRYRGALAMVTKRFVEHWEHQSRLPTKKELAEQMSGHFTLAMTYRALATLEERKYIEGGALMRLTDAFEDALPSIFNGLCEPYAEGRDMRNTIHYVTNLHHTEMAKLLENVAAELWQDDRALPFCLTKQGAGNLVTKHANMTLFYVQTSLSKWNRAILPRLEQEGAVRVIEDEGSGHMAVYESNQKKVVEASVKREAQGIRSVLPLTDTLQTIIEAYPMGRMRSREVAEHLLRFDYPRLHSRLTGTKVRR